MSNQYALIITDGYVSRFAPFNEVYPLVFGEGEEAVEVDESEFHAMRLRRDGRFRYVAGGFVFEADADNPAIVSAQVIAQRGALLAQSDWTQLPDVPLGTKAAWAEYRQALRDITDQAGFPMAVVWPVPPNR